MEILRLKKSILKLYIPLVGGLAVCAIAGGLCLIFGYNLPQKILKDMAFLRALYLKAKSGGH